MGKGPLITRIPVSSFCKMGKISTVNMHAEFDEQLELIEGGKIIWQGSAVQLAECIEAQ